MKTVYFEDHRKSGNDAYDIYRFFTDLKTKNDLRIVFSKDIYDIDSSFCFERALHISNHGWNGFKRIALLLEDMENIELDFSGSTLLTHGVITVAALLGSKNISVKNLVLENHETGFMQTRVTAHGDGYVDVTKELGGDQLHIRNGGELAYSYYEAEFDVQCAIEFRPDTGELEYGTNDFPFLKPLRSMRLEDIGNGVIRVHGVDRYPPMGNKIVFYNTRRLGCSFFMEDCADVHFENVTIHSCHGMGLLAQTCHNISLNSFNTLRRGDRYYTANVDATHFVNCTGLITVENSTFENQFDDALNIHGMYTRVEKALDNRLFVREVHGQAKGIRIFREGDRIQAVNFNSLIPYTEKTVQRVEYINQDLIVLTLLESCEDIKVGDSIENITRAADLIFRNNTVRNNRARGMLIATRGKTVIENNYFHTSGAAILFEANGDFWYESGGTLDVTIQNNTFDSCRYAKWGDAVISCVARKTVEEGKYFSKNIRIVGNRFDMINDCVVSFNNVENATFSGNLVSYVEGADPKITLKHVKNADLNTDIKIEY